MTSPVIIPKTFVNKPEHYPESLASSEVRRRFLALLGPFETPTVPLNLRITDEQTLEGNVIRQRVEYAVAPGEIVPAFHLFRKDIPPEAPGILAIHAHGGDDIFPVGKVRHCHPNPSDPDQYAYRTALAAFRVLAPDALCFGERQATWGYSRLFMDEINAHMELTARGRSLAWKSIWDNSRALEVLESFGASRLGLIGHSGGSTQGYILAAANEKVRAAVCTYSFMTLRHQFYQYHLAHCLYHYLPGMVDAGIDWDQVVALVAPRKLFLGWGAKDVGTPEVMYRAFWDAIELRCNAEGLPPSVVTHEEPDKGHEVTEAMLTNALMFLTKNLAK